VDLHLRSDSCDALPSRSVAPSALFLNMEEAASQLKLRDGSGAKAAYRPTPPVAQAVQGGLQDPAMTSALQMAELLHCVREVMLPRMREPNTAVAGGAVAALYELLIVAPSCSSQPFLAVAAATSSSPLSPAALPATSSQHAVCRLMLSETTLVKQVSLIYLSHVVCAGGVCKEGQREMAPFALSLALLPSPHIPPTLSASALCPPGALAAAARPRLRPHHHLPLLPRAALERAQLPAGAHGGAVGRAGQDAAPEP
jgi:hypothetical protein